MRQTKLIAGKMNVLRTLCKIGYAEGSNRPKRVVIPKPFNPVIVLRKMKVEAA